MILIFGGTTEGRKAVQVVDKAGKPFYYSTKGDLQEIHSLHGIRLTGVMDAIAMKQFCETHSIRLLVDAAHPFAVLLHQTIADVSEKLQIPAIRFDRIYPPRDHDITWCEDYADAILQLEQQEVKCLLALTGVNTISALKPFWQSHLTWLRILRREESLAIARNEGFPEQQLLFFEQGDNDTALFHHIRPDAILTKESGISGGFVEKSTMAREAGIRLFAVKRPPVPDEFYPVNGEHGLRRAIEQLLPGFYPLRTGVTTGSCATAGVVAALKALITGEDQPEAAILLPDGETIVVPVRQVTWAEKEATAVVIKDSGDDTDVTNGTAIEICTKISSSSVNSTEILINGGKGVGTVTLPGLGLPVGGPAINTGPQKMIRENILHTLSSLRITEPLSIEVVISVPQGEELATRTFNPRLGVVGGISIIGTSGIIQPFSTEAFIASIRKSAEVAKASGTPRVVINSGAKSEKYLRNHYPELPEPAFVHYGNYIGETLKIAAELEIKAVTLGVMIGKAVKLAEGYLDTHSQKTIMNKMFLQQLAKETGCGKDTIAAIGNITMARELWSLISPQEHGGFYQKIISLCHQHGISLFPQGELTVLLIQETGEVYGEHRLDNK